MENFEEKEKTFPDIEINISEDIDLDEKIG